MTAAGQFLGAWRVREYAFAPSGERLGIVEQHRRLERTDGGRIRVIQDCEPERALASHPMGRFAGHHEFELSVDGRARRYHGPAVIGTGLSFGEGAMWGRGVWPEFGHNFTSFAVLVTPGRQLTGGRFLRATEMIANIAGVAVNEAAGGTEPHLAGPTWPGEVARTWVGSILRFSASAVLTREYALQRVYDAGRGFHETGGDDARLHFAPGDGCFRVTGGAGGRPIVGLAKQHGWLLDIDAAAGPDLGMEWMEMLDAVGGHLIGFRRWFVDHVLAHVDVVRLSPG